MAPGKNQESDQHYEDAEQNAPHQRSRHEHRQSGDQVVGVDVGPFVVGDEHGCQQRGPAGEDQAVDRDDDRRALQVLQFRVLDLAVHLSEALLAAHGEDGVAEGHQDAKQAEDRQAVASQKPECIIAEMEIGGDGRWRQMGSADGNRITAPDQQNDHHHRGDLHNAQRLVARLLNALDVLPPVIDRHSGSQQRRRVVHVQLDGIVVHVHQGRRQPMPLVCNIDQFVEKPSDVLPGGNAGDGAGEDVVEHQRGNAELGEAAAERLLDYAIHAAARKHRTAFDVHRTHGEAEQHDAENEPRGCRAHRLFGDATCVKR